MQNGERESYANNKARAAELEARQARILALNDRFRTTLIGGRVTLTAGIQALGQEAVETIFRLVTMFDQFTEHNDPHGEHDFGTIPWAGASIFWKIDYYDKQLEYGSPDSSDPDVTSRVLTVMLASEY